MATVFFRHLYHRLNDLELEEFLGQFRHNYNVVS